MSVIWWSLAAAGLAVAYALYNMRWVLTRKAGDSKMREVAVAIQQGAKAYLNRQYRAVGIIAVIVVALLWLSLGYQTALGFSVGAILSALSGYLGMFVAVR